MVTDNEKLMLEASINKSNYPRITIIMVEFFRQAQNAIKMNPNYLQDETCPYDPRIRSYLEELFLSSDITSAEINADVIEYFGEGKDDRTYDLIVRDAKMAYLTMTRLGQKLEKSTKPEEQLSKVKSLAQIQERLLAIIEKAEGFRQIHEFKRVILEIVANSLTPDQRTLVMEQIEQSLKS